jgi:type II secretory pathway pseudopilin PulG
MTRTNERGAVLIAVLLFVLVTTLAANAMVASYRTAAQRDRERELLFVGDQYRRAIASYYNTVPAGQARRLPQRLEDLVEDNRFATPRHHLRRLYPDPITGSRDWQAVIEAGGISGIHSSSTAVPIKRVAFPADDAAFENKASYSDWVFRIDLK